MTQLIHGCTSRNMISTSSLNCSLISFLKNRCTLLEICGWNMTDHWQLSRVKTTVCFETVQMSGLRALKVAIYKIHGNLLQCLSCFQTACPKSGLPGSLNNNKAKSVNQATKKVWSGSFSLVHYSKDIACLNISHANQM